MSSLTDVSKIDEVLAEHDELRIGVIGLLRADGYEGPLTWSEADVARLHERVVQGKPNLSR